MAFVCNVKSLRRSYNFFSDAPFLHREKFSGVCFFAFISSFWQFLPSVEAFSEKVDFVILCPGPFRASGISGATTRDP